MLKLDIIATSELIETKYPFILGLTFLAIKEVVPGIGFGTEIPTLVHLN